MLVRAAEDGSPELVVRDQGIGMSGDTLAHLFEPFRQAEQGIDRARGGLGLGLFLVKGIAGLMGGQVSARSDGLGHGSEFSVRFLPARAPAGPAAREGPPHRDARRRILVIEDNDDLRESVIEFLRDHLGHEVASAEDGEAGVARAREWKPEVVICDIGLPRLDGYRVARMLRDEPSLRGAVLVAMTGYGTGGDKARAADSGFDRHFTKPLDVEELQRFIESLPS